MFDEKGSRKLAGKIFGVSPKNILPGIVGPLEGVLSTLFSPREQLVLELRYGLRDGKRRILDEVAALIGVTSRERPRQIEAQAIRRLRHPIHSRILRPYIVDTPIEPETEDKGGKGELS